MLAIFGSEVTIEKPTQGMIAWCRNNLVVANPEYTTKVRMNKWIGNTPAKLYLYKNIDGKLILPAGLRSKFKTVPCTETYTPHKQTSYTLNAKTFEPYDYQLTASESLVNSNYGGLLISAAGSGKTSIAMMAIGKLKGKHLWLTHTKDLLDQSKNRFIQFYGKHGVGVTTAGKINIGERITFATIQTMVKLDFTQYGSDFDVVWCDEAHRVCGSPTKMKMWYKCLSQLNVKRKYGLTATYHRADGMEKTIWALLGEVIYSVPKSATDKTTMKPIVKRINTVLKPSWEYCNTDGTLDWAKLINYVCYDNSRSFQIASDIENSNRESILVLSDRVEQLHCVYDMLVDKRFALVVTGKTKKAERERGIEDMRQGKLRILFSTYQLARDGLDIPRLDTLVLASPNKDFAIITQSTGRIQRTLDGKLEPVVFDYVDTNIARLERMFKDRKKHYNELGATYI